MTTARHTRDAAWELLTAYTQSASLLKHALAVETCMRAYGQLETERLQLPELEAKQRIEIYGVTGLLHDFDYEKYPEQHPFFGNTVLTEQGWPEEVREAILGHADYSGVPRQTHLAKALFACDELAGFLTAVSLVKPTRSILDVEVGGVRRKMKDKPFARAVKREDIVSGASELGVELEAHIARCIHAMQENAAALGLERTAPPGEEDSFAGRLFSD